MIPDAEAVVSGYLRGRDELKTLGARVTGSTPGDKTKPWVRVVQLDANAVDDHRADHLIGWFGQLDCYAGSDGGQGEASLLTRTVRAVLAEMYRESFEGVTITGCRFVSCPRLPDDAIEPARERFVLSVVVYMHPS